MCRTALLLAFTGIVLAAPGAVSAQSAAPLHDRIDSIADEIQMQVVRWRRDFHEHPELGNRETRTAGVIASELARLGYDVEAGVAHTGVVAVLRGGRAPADGGPVVALRADMDALPVTEQVDVPFRSTATATWNGETVGVMHACGHDAHMAMLLGAATILARLQPELPGTIKLLFQPAEEGPPPGEEGGASLMVTEGALQGPDVDAIFGLHVMPLPAGAIEYRPGPTMASADSFTIRVTGRQTHGAEPWAGVDPIVVGSQIVLALQTIVSRTVDITDTPAVVTVGAFRGGNRFNIVPEIVEMEGTVRTYDERVRQDIHRRIRELASGIAGASGATAEVEFGLGYPVTANDPELTGRMVPTLRRIAGDERVSVARLRTTAEDFSYYQQQVPGLFFFLGIVPEGQDPATAPANHSPLFTVDESALPVGTRALAALAVDYLFAR